ncbi:hypothetical protein EYC84_010200 [Monilinia fructicola]|uniref:Uncharacterized protein n=1 Tax=Monilinia fructicola TaxID=38448 RepID=A0A5M9JHD9_MONFR|nr:hypothetical protein EYC84_010200 [Monilinia fructicola]
MIQGLWKLRETVPPPSLQLTIPFPSPSEQYDEEQIYAPKLDSRNASIHPLSIHNHPQIFPKKHSRSKDIPLSDTNKN